jgi:hypothetical protein
MLACDQGIARDSRNSQLRYCPRNSSAFPRFNRRSQLILGLGEISSPQTPVIFNN